MARPRYFVVEKSNWQGSGWQPVAEFDDKESAEQEANKRAVHELTGTGGLDIKSENHTKVVSRSWLKAHGWNNEHDLLEHLYNEQIDEAESAQ